MNVHGDNPKARRNGFARAAMAKLPTIAVTILVVAAVASTAQALSGDEVVVVANANDPGSVSLGKFYASARNIPQQNILLVRTTTSYEMKRDEYDKQIHQPLREFLTKHKSAGKIRCVVLMWGVPVRVKGGVSTSEHGGVVAAYKRVATKAHYRLAIDCKLLATVGKIFPKAQTRQLKPIGGLFASPSPAPAEPLTKIKTLKKEFDRAFAQKRTDISRIKDPGKRALATRQLMALQLDANGLGGLIKYIGKYRPAGTPSLDELNRQLAAARGKWNQLARLKPTAQNVKARLAALEDISGVAQVAELADRQYKKLRLVGADAAVDSELALLWHGRYELIGMLPNPLHWRRRPGPKQQKPPATVMTARIDGPSRADAMRIVKASLATEKAGLQGKFYIDAGGPYAPYDIHLKKLYSFLSANTKMQIILDEKKPLFPSGSCRQAGLYVGWYSLKRYVPAFSWTTGAVGWHIASFEAGDLRNPKSQQWCVKMIQNGVAATLGAVNEPFLGSFPAPEDFFALLLTGKYTIAECYWRTTPTVSWRMTLIADPLYNPFAANPQLDVKVLPSGLAP